MKKNPLKTRGGTRVFAHGEDAHAQRLTSELVDFRAASVNPSFARWAGHEEDSDVKSSRINRGYTIYGTEYLKSEAEKVNYIIDIT